MVQITRDGLIRGGVAEREFSARQTRLDGAWAMWDWYCALGRVETSKRGSHRITKHPNFGWRRIAEKMRDGGREIGAYRCQDVLRRLGKRWFTLDLLAKRIEAECAHVSDGLGKMLGGEPFVQADHEYQERVRSGHYGPQRA